MALNNYSDKDYYAEVLQHWREVIIPILTLRKAEYQGC
jgi:hypothetical protein